MYKKPCMSWHYQLLAWMQSMAWERMAVTRRPVSGRLQIASLEIHSRRGETNALNPLPMTVCHSTDNAWGKQRVTGHRTRSNISRNIREKNTVTQCSVDIHDLLNSLPTNKANNNGETGSRNWKPECLIKLKLKKRSFFLCLSNCIS